MQFTPKKYAIHFKVKGDNSTFIHCAETKKQACAMYQALKNSNPVPSDRKTELPTGGIMYLPKDPVISISLLELNKNKTCYNELETLCQKLCK